MSPVVNDPNTTHPICPVAPGPRLDECLIHPRE
jgi:hypothetical protein